MKSYWMAHKGRKIFISDFSNLGGDALAVHQECESIKAVLANEKPKSLLAIVDVNGTFVNDGIVQAFKNILPYTNQYVKRRAVIGMSGFRRHFIFLVSKFVGDVNFAPFDTLEEALDWIVKE